MNTFCRTALPILLPTVLLACDGRGPTEPTTVTQPTAAGQPAPPPPPGQTFNVAGVVTDERGAPMAGAVVTMAHWVGGHVEFPSVSTDATGGYAISFTANPLGSSFVARAQVVAEGYEEYWRSLMGTGGTTFTETFRLHRVTRMTAGDAMTLSVPPDTGECRGWVAEVCPIVRVVVPTDGRLRIEVIPSDGSAPTPPVEVCCVRGSEEYGNPITVPVAAGVELEVKVGMPRGYTTIQSFRVMTAFEAS
ncbi:hypothetical protein LuPra_02062 [Luteitalea pratensis]|uniref:Carboxypeptidase regulatory-like domain-containing protein n=1 Tax=Luteitalea pratensis TaxID=1855912 RepID=A0A143PKA2_LUTPR|nr:carboxypeptidase-like regulatory domain-containing protein [Luteitalea pratensis]AMY08856.1 hypothetical protein LuPra_02062 [Luteitalea pratensis]